MSTTTGDVEIQILDGGAGVVVVPASSVQVIIGCCSSGTAATIVASRDGNKLQANVGSGPGVDLAATSIAAGGTALFMKAATVTPGAPSNVTPVALGTCTIGVSGVPFDAYLVKLLVTKAGTVAADGIRFRLSLDAGRNYGPEIALGTAVTYAMSGTGLTLSFGGGTLLLGGTATFGCTPPLSDTAGIQACLVALEASPYSISGWGSLIIDGPWTGAEAATIEGFLDTMVTSKTFTRAILSARDADLPTAYGGVGEDEQDWIDDVELDYSALSAKRVSASAGHYNIPSQFPVPSAGLPRMRRPGAWAYAAREVTIRPQTHAGRVSDGALAQIVVDPTNDPNDGFIYHDERTSPSLDGARFTSFRTRKGKPGFFVVNPNLMSPSGSVFTLLPLGNVMDIGCGLLHQTGEQFVNSDVKLNDNGTIDEKAAQYIESTIRAVLRDNMLAKSMISDFTFSVDRTNDVRATSIVNFAATLFSRGYILEIDAVIGFGNNTGG